MTRMRLPWMLPLTRAPLAGIRALLSKTIDNVCGLNALAPERC